MNRRKSLLLISLFVCFVGAAVWARQFYFEKSPDERKPVLPDVREEYHRIIGQLLDSTRKKNIAGRIRLYDGEIPDRLKEEQSFRYYQGNNSSFYASLGYQKTLCDGSIILMVDSVNKILIVSKVDSQMLQSSTTNVMNNLPLSQLLKDTIFNDISGTISENGNTRTMQFAPGNIPQVHSFKMIYDKDSYQVNSSEIEWWKNGSASLDSTAENKVWITKIDYDYSLQNRMDIERQMSRILVLRNNRIVPTKEYSDYDIRINVMPAENAD